MDNNAVLNCICSGIAVYIVVAGLVCIIVAAISSKHTRNIDKNGG